MNRANYAHAPKQRTRENKRTVALQFYWSAPEPGAVVWEQLMRVSGCSEAEAKAIVAAGRVG